MQSGRSSVGDRLPFLEGIRGLLALYVVLGHIMSLSDPNYLTGRPSAASPWLQTVGGWLAFGHMAVAGFIVVSGYCLQLSLYVHGKGEVRQIRAFFARRARRILPAYYACLAVSLLVCLFFTQNLGGRPFEQYLPVTWENTLAHVFLIHNWRTDWMYKINGVLWSIAIEVQLYLLFPMLAWALAKLGRLITSAAITGAVIACMVQVPGANKLYFWYLGLFVLGMIAASWAYRPSLRFGPMPVAGGFFLLLGFGLMLAWRTTPGLALRDLAAGIFLAALCYQLTIRPTNLTARILGWRPLFWLGGFSYSLYLMHHPIMQILFSWQVDQVRRPDGMFWHLLAWLPLVLLLSWIFAWFFERPFTRGASDTGQEQPRELVPISLPLQTVVSSHEHAP